MISGNRQHPRALAAEKGMALLASEIHGIYPLLSCLTAEAEGSKTLSCGGMAHQQPRVLLL